MTDYEVKVLENLRECCAGNAAEMTSCGTYAAKFGDSEESNGSTPSSAASVAGDAWNFVSWLVLPMVCVSMIGQVSSMQANYFTVEILTLISLSKQP